jgi:flavin-dependent dehydrogenase
MIDCDVLIVGGGPAGSSCAWRLVQHRVDCLVLDESAFPRTKLCAGWITPEVIRDLEMDVADYPHRLLSFDDIRIRAYGLGFSLQGVQHSIRRYEFDDWLLKRSGSPVRTHRVKSIRKQDGHYVIDDRYRCRYLVGAGGTRCPVYRTLFKDANPRARELQAMALEQEFPYEYQDDRCRLWFFEKGFPGYSWYVPKARGYINIGIGGMAVQLKHRKQTIQDHWDNFARGLERRSLVQGVELEPKGYSYYLNDGVRVGRIENAFILGDAAGLATRDMAEGIGPAVASGLKAADAIVTGSEYSLGDIQRFTTGRGLARKALEYMLVERSRRRAVLIGAGTTNGHL